MSASKHPDAVRLTPRSSSESTREQESMSLSPMPSASASPERPLNASNNSSLPSSSTQPNGLSQTSAAVAETVREGDHHRRGGGGDSDSGSDELGEGSPMLHRWNSETSRGSPEDERDELLRLASEDEDDFEDEEAGLGAPVGTPGGSGVLGGTWEASRGTSPGGSGLSESHLTRGQKRRVYGGGKHGEALEGGTMSAGEVGGLVLAGTLSPTPLLLPHAAALLGLPLFLPLLFLTAVLSWFSYLVLGVESRYVGARSWPSLTSAVFPHRLKTHRLGEFLSAIIVLASSLARGITAVVAASEIVVDVIRPEGGRRWWERIVGVSIISASWLLVPIAVLPFVKSLNLRRRSSSASALTRLPAYTTFFFWPLALLILGVRLQKLNELARPSPPVVPRTLPAQGEVMGLSIWGGISIIVFSLSSHQDTFRYITSLARPPSTSTRSSNRSPTIGSTVETSTAGGRRAGRRNQWPLASALGVGGAAIIQMGWGLVGYLGIDGGGHEGNLFASPRLPRGDPWLSVVRILVLGAILIGIEPSLDTAYIRVRKGLVFAFGSGKAGSSSRRTRGGSYSRVGSGGGGEDDRRGWDWRTIVTRLLVWMAIASVSIVVTGLGERGEGLVSVAEISGCILSTLLGFLIPSLFFVALFHLRRPRSIFISDPNAPMYATDTLLMRKEREVQRRLSGRRIWMDVVVFGGLLPFGIVVLMRACVAIALKED